MREENFFISKCSDVSELGQYSLKSTEQQQKNEIYNPEVIVKPLQTAHISETHYCIDHIHNFSIYIILFF